MQSTGQYDWRSLIGSRFSPPDPAPIREALCEKRVLVTGAGGSIGSALAREIAHHGVGLIVLLDAAEHSLYQIEGTLDAPHAAILLNVCDQAGLNEVFERYRPQIVFHGAAFKHVPLMERNPFAAIQNNALGTFFLSRAAVGHGVQQMILVSTDKAVDPIGIMGVSKRIAELVFLSMPHRSTSMSAVRLGNVIGSAGSAFPHFLNQLARGEPVTVTHPEARRYFSTVEEAVGLLLLASAQAADGILVPDLGPPFSIAELAGKLVAAVQEQTGSLRTPDAGIVFTGLRPGDKLTEALLSPTESFLSPAGTPLRAIHSPSRSWPEVERVMVDLQQSVERRDLSRMLEIVAILVPEYRPSAVIRDACSELAGNRAS